MNSFVIFGGNLYACGSNGSGQLGISSSSKLFKFVEVINPIDKLPFSIVQVVPGYTHTMILDDQGRLYACGNNSSGQLGLGDDQNRSSFTLVKLPFLVTQVACGAYYTMIVDDQGKLYVCGNNEYGQLGLGDERDKYEFTEVINPMKNLPFEVNQVACGSYHSLILDIQGRLYACGANGNGQLGLGDHVSNNNFTEVINTELSADNLPFEIKQIACGHEHTMILDNQGKLYSCGRNRDKQLGISDINYILNFTEVNLPFEVTQVTCGESHTVIVDNIGQLYVCGNNIYGQLGLGGGIYDKYEFTRVKLPFDVTQVSCGPNHTLIVDDQGQLYTCGDCFYGQLGLGDSDINRNQFTLVKDVEVDRLQNVNVRFKNMIKAAASMVFYN